LVLSELSNYEDSPGSVRSSPQAASCSSPRIERYK